MQTQPSKWCRVVIPAVVPPVGACVTGDADCWRASPLEMIRRGETARREGGWSLAIDALSGRGHYSWACAMTAQHGPTEVHPSRLDARGRMLPASRAELPQFSAAQRAAGQLFRATLGRDFGWDAWHAFFDVCEAFS